MAPSAMLASCEPGTVAVQVPAPEAGTEMVRPSESVSVMVRAFAPGCVTPFSVMPPATLAALTVLTLAPRASFAPYGTPAQSAFDPAVAPTSKSVSSPPPTAAAGPVQAPTTAADCARKWAELIPLSPGAAGSEPDVPVVITVVPPSIVGRLSVTPMFSKPPSRRSEPLAVTMMALFGSATAAPAGAAATAEPRMAAARGAQRPTDRGSFRGCIDAFSGGWFPRASSGRRDPAWRAGIAHVACREAQRGWCVRAGRGAGEAAIVPRRSP